jgi:hypothetical protein
VNATSIPRYDFMNCDFCFELIRLCGRRNTGET